MAHPNPSWSAETDELYDLEYLARANGVQSEDDLGAVYAHPAVNRQLMSVDEKLYQPSGVATEGPAYENLSLVDAFDDSDLGFDRWDY
ncbi:MAG TPA: hypothetical protein VKZ48_07290 [Burkholderiales bacterium]|nr:hypothetical protein [Burkholderiales bacterium]